MGVLETEKGPRSVVVAAGHSAALAVSRVSVAIAPSHVVLHPLTQNSEEDYKQDEFDGDFDHAGEIVGVHCGAVLLCVVREIGWPMMRCGDGWACGSLIKTGLLEVWQD